jgi:uncharacterized protein YkwD
LFLLGFWAALTLLGPIGSAAFEGGQPDPGIERLEAELHAAVNAWRAERHRIALGRRPELDRVARAHSQDMATRGFLAHVNPDGADPVARLQAGRVGDFSMAGENVGQTSRPGPNDEILQGWIHSPVHRENLLGPAFNATGLGIARAPDGTLYYTQVYVTFPR